MRDSKGIIYFKWKRILPTVSGSISRKKFGMEFHFLTIQKDTFVPIVNVGEKRKTDIHTYIVHTRMRYSCKNLVKETFFLLPCTLFEFKTHTNVSITLLLTA